MAEQIGLHSAGSVTSGLIRIRGLSKKFSGTLALDSVDFDLDPGEIHALLGENGAGKSTLIKILAGIHVPDQGEIRVRGRVVAPWAERLPFAFIHQDLGLVGDLSVAENIALVAGYQHNHGAISWRRTRREGSRVLERIASRIDPDVKVDRLSAADKSLVAIARALAVRAAVLILDEPTAALPEADVARLMETLAGLRAEGLGIIYVSHRLDEVFRLADRATVLRDGRRVWSDAVAATTPRDLVVTIVGRPLDEVFVAPPQPESEELLEVRDLECSGVGPCSFNIRAGEVVGLVGLRGAGHDVVGRALFGDAPIHGGTMRLGGRPYEPRQPGEALRAGVIFASSKRAEEGMAAELTVRENLFPKPGVTPDQPWRLIDIPAERRHASQVAEHYNIRPADPERSISTLSGGNQQKVVLARSLERGARLLVLEEPTAGVDVGAKVDIYSAIHASAQAGQAVIIVSSDFEEVSGISHRALVFVRGKVAAEVARQDLSIGRLTAIAAAAITGNSGEVTV